MNQGQGYDGPPDDRPFLMPAGMPPGAEYTHEERPPEGVYYFRIYAAFMCVVCAGCVLLGLTIMVVPLLSPKSSASDAEAWLGGFFYAFLGTLFFIPWVMTLFGGRRPWVHTLGTVMIALGMTSLCCAPIQIPLLITWLKPETKRWYGAA